MDEFEQHISSLLVEAVPEPRGEIDVEDVRSLARSRHSSVRRLVRHAARRRKQKAGVAVDHRRRLAIVGAIAAVATIAAGTYVFARGDDRPKIASAPGPSSPPVTRPSTTTDPSELATASWQLTKIVDVRGVVPSAASAPVVFTFMGQVATDNVGDAAAAHITPGRIDIGQWANDLLNHGTPSLDIAQANFVYDLMHGALTWSITGNTLTLIRPGHGSLVFKRITAKSTTSPTSSSVSTGTLPWHAKVIARHDVDLRHSLVSDGTNLAEFTAGSIALLDPVTGSSRSTVSLPPNSLPPIAVGNAAWVVSGSPIGREVQLTRLSLSPLSITTSQLISLSSGVIGEGLSITPSANGDTIFVGAGAEIIPITTASTDEQQRIFIHDGTVRALAASPDGKSLYVGVQTTNGFALDTLALATDTVTRSVPIYSNLLSGNEGLVASGGGVWVAVAGGMSENVAFYPGADPSSAVSGAEGGGGFPATVSIIGGVAWLTGPYGVACADPQSGAERSSVPSADTHGRTFADVAKVGARWYATVPSVGVVTFSPPAECDAK